MIVQAEDMAREVRVAIDMNANSDALIADGDPDTLTLNDVIYAKLPDAVRMVEMEAPLHLLENGHDFGEDVFVEEDGRGFAILPADFLRLVAFRMSDWHRTVYDVITETDPRYALVSSRWPGIRGCPEKPVCALVTRNEGRVLEFYSCRDASATVEHASYVPVPRIDGNGGIDVSEGCYRAAVYRAAALALASVGDQLSTTMLEMSRGLLV